MSDSNLDDFDFEEEPEAPVIVDAGIPPRGGWDNQADIVRAKKYCRDMHGYVTAGHGDAQRGQLWEIISRLRDFGIRERTAVVLVMAHNEPPQERTDVETVAWDVYRKSVLRPGQQSIKEPPEAEWTPPEQDDPDDLTWLEGGPPVWPKPLVYDAKNNSAKLAEVFMAERPSKLIHTDGVLYTLEGGKVWREMSPEELAAEIRYTDPALHLDTSKIFGMVTSIRLATYTKARPFEWIDAPHDAPDAHNLILFRNGILDFERGKLLPHTGEYFATGVPNFDYDSTATCPLWLAKVGEWLHADYHATAQEWFGYCLTPDVSIEVFVAMIGATRGGKGTMSDVLQKLVGPSHHCSRTLGDLGGDFGLEGTLDKRLLFIPDAHDVDRFKRGTALERIKCITGRDDVSVNRKNKPLVNARIPAKLTMVANRHPKFLDESGALAARELLLMFDRSFRGREDKELRAKLTAELPGIANWALAGLRRLRANDRRFTIGESGRAASIELAESQSPMRRFARDFLMVTGNDDHFEPLADVFAVYEHWALHVESLNSRELRSRDDFKSDLVAAFRDRGVAHTQRRWHDVSKPNRGKGKPKRGLWGLRLTQAGRAIADACHS